MGAFIGALLGAVTIVLIGKSTKGRDFLGLAVAMFFLSLVISVGLSPIFYASEKQAAAQTMLEGKSAAHLDMAGIIVSAVFAYLAALLPGALFVGIAKGEKS